MAGAVARMALPLTGLVLGAVAAAAVLVGLDRLAVSDRDAERRALLARDAALTRAALVPGSPLACLDAGAGEAIEDACEKAVFGSAQGASAAVAYMDARLQLLSEAVRLADRGDGSALAALASTRRAVELDRYGIAAHVLQTRDACTAAKCAAFGLVADASALKANMRSDVFDQYVSRYVDRWRSPAPEAPKAPAVSQAPAVPPLASAAPGVPTPAVPIKPGEKWDFPSAASIPPVSIMNSEPPLPKGAGASAQAPGEKPPNGGAAQASRNVPVPPLPPPPPSKHPSPQAAPAISAAPQAAPATAAAPQAAPEPSAPPH